MADWRVQIKDAASLAMRMPAAILFPPVCAGCRRHVQEPGSLCGKCWPKLRFLEQPWCAIMGTPFSHEMGDGLLSAEAIANPPPFDRSRAAVAYSGIASQMVQGLKYHDRTDLAPWMAKWMVRVGYELLPDADVVVPVPLHARRFFKRRFNQSAELARAICRQTGKPFETSMVSRVKMTKQQVGLGQKEREDNVRAAFVVSSEALDHVRGRRILLVDDVYTTGATVSAVAKALKKAKASAVDVLTFARVLPGDFRPED